MWLGSPPCCFEGHERERGRERREEGSRGMEGGKKGAICVSVVSFPMISH